MANLVLLLIGQLGDCPSPLRDEKNRVVPETTGSSGLDDLTLTLAAYSPHLPIRRCESERGHKPRPPGPWAAAKGGKEPVDPLGSRGSQARRANPWRAGQRLNLEPAVIPQGPLARGAGCGDRLCSRVFLVRLTHLVDVSRMPDDL